LNLKQKKCKFLYDAHMERQLPCNSPDDRYAIECWDCSSLTWFDTDEELPDTTACWRCGEIINPDL